MTDLHEDYSREDEIEGSSDRSFGLVFAAAFGIYGLWPLLDVPRSVRFPAIAAGAGFLFVALVVPKILAPLNRIWMKIGLLLGRVVNPIVMGLLFFLTITPIGVMRRLLGADAFRRGFDRGAASYWIERKPPGPPPESMRQQF
jgi:predicted membrane metal-binding protein